MLPQWKPGWNHIKGTQKQAEGAPKGQNYNKDYNPKDKITILESFWYK